MALKYLYVPSAVQANKAYGVLPNSANADFSFFSRSSAGSRVDKNGFINTGLGLGSEEVTNGGFSSDSNWTKGAGWTIANGVAINQGNDGSQQILQTGVVSADKSYEMTITVVSNEGTGNNTIYIGNKIVSNTNLGVGTYTFQATPTSGSTINIFCSTGGEFSIDNVSVREITEVNTDVPRIDYTGGGCPSLLLEPASTNYIEYSEDFNQSYWQHNADITTTNSSELAPNGRLNANLIEYDGSGYSFIRIYGSVPSTASTLSVFAKKGNWRYFGLRHFQASGNDHTVFDFDTETFSNTASGQIASFEVFPDGWYKIKVTHPSPESNSIVGFAISNSSGAESNTTGGQVANVHLFGAQLENQSYATSYIPNYGTAAGVTRSQDVGGSTGDLSSVINSSEGVLYFEGSALTDSSELRKFGINDGSVNSNAIYIYYHSALNYIFFQKYVNSIRVVNVDTTSYSQLENLKIAIKYNSTYFDVFINGNKIFNVSNTDSFASDTLTNLSFDSGSVSTEPFYGNVKEIRIYDEALSDTELQELTTI